MQYSGRLNSYLHRPVQVIALDADEVKIIFILLIIAFVVGGTLSWALFFCGPWIIIPYKRKQTRGFLTYFLTRAGMRPVYGYPPSNVDTFYE